jgi:hypothetical protein
MLIFGLSVRERRGAIWSLTLSTESSEEDGGGGGCDASRTMSSTTWSVAGLDSEDAVVDLGACISFRFGKVVTEWNDVEWKEAESGKETVRERDKGGRKENDWLRQRTRLISPPCLFAYFFYYALIVSHFIILPPSLILTPTSPMPVRCTISLKH